MYRISKQFHFEYGHRVWSQKLDKELSCNAPCACRHLHGHSGKVTVFLEGENLNEQGMVLDFVELNFIKQLIDNIVDHKFLIDKNDPALPFLVDDRNPLESYLTRKSKYYIEINPIDGINEYLNEIRESFVVVDFVPTSENLAKWMFDMVDEKLPKGLLKQIEWQETEKSRSVYVRK